MAGYLKEQGFLGREKILPGQTLSPSSQIRKSVGIKPSEPEKNPACGPQVQVGAVAIAQSPLKLDSTLFFRGLLGMPKALFLRRSDTQAQFAQFPAEDRFQPRCTNGKKIHMNTVYWFIG